MPVEGRRLLQTLGGLGLPTPHISEEPLSLGFQFECPTTEVALTTRLAGDSLPRIARCGPMLNTTCGIQQLVLP